MRLLWRRLVLFFVTLVTLLAPTLASMAPVSAESGGWFENAGASAIKEGDISASDTFANTKCTKVTLPVVSYYTDWITHVTKSNQDMCMVSTLNGLVDKNGRVIQPYGFDEAHAIADNLPGHGVIQPVPNQDSVVYFSSSSYTGALSLNLYRNFYTHLHYNLFRQSFDLSDAPDFPVKFADGKLMPVDPLSLATSPNGRYIVANVVGTGYVRIDTATLEVKPFAASNGYNQFGTPLGSSLAIDNSGRYAALSFAPSGSQDSLKIVDIDSCTTAELPAAIGGKVNVECPTRDILPAIAGSMTGMRLIPSLRFTNEHVLEADVQDGANNYARYAVLASGAQKSGANYLAMGDSFMSGEGAWSYRTGTDTDLNKCHQSILSYPYLLSGRFNSFASVACSGARAAHITGTTGVKGTSQLKDDQIPSDQMIEDAQKSHLPGYLAQRDFLSDNPDVITLSIAGNDIGFSDIIVRCTAPFAGDITPNTNCYEWYEDRLELVNTINAQFNKLVSLYSSMKAVDRKVYVVGYPQLVSVTGSCALNVRLGDDERQFANQLISYLDSVIQRAAAKAGVYYVDTQHAFDGHKLCEGKDTAVNGLTKGDDALYVIANESYHPNQRGQELLADAVAAGTHNFTETMSAPDTSVTNPAADDSLPILQVPKQPRGINQTLQDNDETVKLITRGDSSNFDVDGYGGYLAPNSSANVTLHSSPVNLGSVAVDANGEIHAQLTIPADTVPGSHTLHFYAQNIAGQPVDIQKTIYVAASADDYDGDGVVNAEDSCRGVPNSGVDEDKDGVDDACDPELKAATIPSEPSDPDTGSAPTLPSPTLPNLVVASDMPLTPVSTIAVPKIPIPLSAADTTKTVTATSGAYASAESPVGVVAGSHTTSNVSAKPVKGSSTPWFMWLLALLGLLVLGGGLLRYRRRG